MESNQTRSSLIQQLKGSQKKEKVWRILTNDVQDWFYCSCFTWKEGSAFAIGSEKQRAKRCVLYRGRHRVLHEKIGSVCRVAYSRGEGGGALPPLPDPQCPFVMVQNEYTRKIKQEMTLVVQNKNAPQVLFSLNVLRVMRERSLAAFMPRQSKIADGPRVGEELLFGKRLTLGNLKFGSLGYCNFKIMQVKNFVQRSVSGRGGKNLLMSAGGPDLKDSLEAKEGSSR